MLAHPPPGEATIDRTLGDLRLGALLDRVRSSLWFLPAVGVVAATVTALLLSRVGLGQPIAEGEIGFGGTPEGARALVSTVAGASISVATLTFSLTVVALQVASSQFSPRILRSFLADRGNQAVLATFLSTFAFSLVTLRSIRGGGGGAEGDQPFVPDWAVGGTILLTALSVAMLVFFIHHITQQLRVESVLQDLQRLAIDTVRGHLPMRGSASGGEEGDVELPEVPPSAVTLRSTKSGYLQAVEADELLRVASAHGVVVRIRPRVGGPVTEGASLAWAWPVEQDAGIAADRVEPLAREVGRGCLIGFERSLRQDVAFGIRQVIDIAVKALSPGINDPATAVATIGALTPVLAEVVGRRAGHRVGRDELGRVRVAIDEPTFGELLGLACDQPRRYAKDEPAVLVALLEMLGDLAELQPEDPEAIRTQVELTREVARSGELSGHELDRVEVVAGRALATLDGGIRVARADDEDDEVEEPAG